jgi:hypothetical protein
MSDFVFLYTGGGSPRTEEEQARVMKAWSDWFAQIGPALKDGGNPFGPVVKTLEDNGTIRDGAAGPQHSGYTIVHADSLETATAIAKGSPVLESGGSVTVYETVDAM